MPKINGFDKRINKFNRVYWENKKGDFHNVEKIGHNWVYTHGNVKGKQYSTTFDNKEFAMGYAKRNMQKGGSKEYPLRNSMFMF